ncbi:MAG: hypothetical protein ABIP63_01060 [Thermoanaerobaculia bacterium]
MKRDVLLLLLIFAVAIAIVDPRGNMPLDDDWDFAVATWHFAKTGHFSFTPFTATSLYAQVLWGALWTRLFGASFFVLRCSILALAALALVVFRALLEKLPLRPWMRFAAAAALLFHPIFFWSSFTYMTHVPFVFCSVVAAYCYLRGSTGLGSLAVIASFFIRQTGVVTAIPAVLLARDRKSRMLAAAPLVVFAVVWPILQHGESGFHAQPWQAPFHGALYLFDHFSAAALFVLPLLIPAIITAPGALGDRRMVIGAVLLFLARALLFLGFANPPWDPILTSTHLFGNVFTNLGLGPQTLWDRAMLGYAYPIHLREGMRLPLTLLSAIAGGILLALVIEKARKAIAGGQPVALRFGVLHLICASGILAFSQLWFDRYTIDATWSLCFVLPLCWPALRSSSSAARVRQAIAFVALLAFALFDTLAVRDYLQWNRDRGQAWQSLVASGVPPLNINGGVELNAMARDPFERPRRNWVIRNDYVLSFNPMDGYDIVQRFGRVYSLRRRSDTKSPPPTSNWR